MINVRFCTKSWIYVWYYGGGMRERGIERRREREPKRERKTETKRDRQRQIKNLEEAKEMERQRDRLEHQ
jgi:hypothetical protein